MAAKKPAERQSVGAMVFLFSQADGQFGLISYDRKVEVWGQSLDAIWPRYYNKSRRLMAKREREEKALLKNQPTEVVAPDPDAFMET